MPDSEVRAFRARRLVPAVAHVQATCFLETDIPNARQSNFTLSILACSWLLTQANEVGATQYSAVGWRLE